MIAKFITEFIKSMLVEKYPWYAWFLHGLEIFIALFGSYIMFSGGEIWGLVFVAYAGLNVYLLRKALKKHDEALHEKKPVGSR